MIAPVPMEILKRIWKMSDVLEMCVCVYVFIFVSSIKMQDLWRQSHFYSLLYFQHLVEYQLQSIEFVELLKYLLHE